VIAAIRQLCKMTDRCCVGRESKFMEMPSICYPNCYPSDNMERMCFYNILFLKNMPA